MEKNVKGSMTSILILCLVVSLFAQTSAKSPLFIFGDSILDVGNNNYINTSTSAQANFWPYGITFFHHPTGRFSDGRVICDFIAEYANLPLIPPYLQPGKYQLFDAGVNFASAAAGALVQTNQGFVIDLHMQLENYKKVEAIWKARFGEGKAKKKLNSAVYLFSVGSNDYLTLYFNNSTFLTSYTKPDYVDMVIANISSVITEIYKTGGRKFAFLNVPNIGCIPLLRMSTANGDCNIEPSKYSLIHNKALVNVLREVKMKLPGFKYSFYDLDTSFQQRIDFPSKYGFEEGKAACCGTGKFRGEFSCGGTRVVKEYELCKNVNEYVFWDSSHLTEKAYKQIADEIWKSSSYGTHSLMELFHLH